MATKSMFQSPAQRDLEESFQRELEGKHRNTTVTSSGHTPSTCNSSEFTHSSALDALAGQETDIYIYAFSRRFYPKRLTLHSSYSFHFFLSALAFPGNRTHDLGVASAMLYYLSYRKADIYTRWCMRKARRIISDSSHPSHGLFSLLPSGRRIHSIYDMYRDTALSPHTQMTSSDSRLTNAAHSQYTE